MHPIHEVHQVGCSLGRFYNENKKVKSVIVYNDLYNKLFAVQKIWWELILVNNKSISILYGPLLTWVTHVVVLLDLTYMINEFHQDLGWKLRVWIYSLLILPMILWVLNKFVYHMNLLQIRTNRFYIFLYYVHYLIFAVLKLLKHGKLGGYWVRRFIIRDHWRRQSESVLSQCPMC